MAKSFVRHFTINAQLPARPTAHITFCGREIAVTDQNSAKIERIRSIDAEAAFEAAVFGREYRSRIAA